MQTKVDAITEQLKRRFPDLPLEFPPACFVTMGGEFLWFDVERKRLRVRFPVKAEFANPMGFMQGGLIVGAIDNTVGPLTFLVAPPSVTTQMNTSYIRPITPELTHFEVEAVVTEQTRRLLFVDAVVYDGDKQLAHARASCTLMEAATAG